MARSPDMTRAAPTTDVDHTASAQRILGWTATGVGTVKWGEVNADFEPLQNGIPVAGGLQTEAFSKLGLSIASTAAGGMDPVAAQIVLPAS